MLLLLLLLLFYCCCVVSPLVHSVSRVRVRLKEMEIILKLD